MNVRLKKDSVVITGYVNAVERDSKTLRDRIGEFIERIAAGAFGRAIERNDNIRILLNHDPARDLGGTKDGNLTLREDAIGLRAKATITDKDVVEKARSGRLVGWSFGFYDRDVEKTDVDGIAHRYVKDLDLEEVSILDDTKAPAYIGTLIEARADGAVFCCGDSYEDGIEIEEEETREEPQKEINYSEFEKMISEMKGEN